jgi:hypothetical protein
MTKTIQIICFIVFIFILALLSPGILLGSFNKSIESLFVALLALVTGLYFLYVLLRVIRKTILRKQTNEDIDMFLMDEEYSEMEYWSNG